jgi:hypothetical protein
MATHWMREVRLTASAARRGSAFYSKMLCWWLYNILGYTNFSESIGGGGGSYNPSAATGTNGVLSNANFNLVDSTYASFSAGDVGKWVLIKDLTNPVNSGWYKITAYVDANTVTIDFRSGATEYPTAATGLSWWMLAEDANTPVTNDDYWRLRTPHADGWEIEYFLYPSFGIRVRVSLNADWTATGKILERPGDGTSGYKWDGHTNLADGASAYWYAEGTTEGSRLNTWMYDTSNPSGISALSVAKLVPYETSPAHTAAELWLLVGNGAAHNVGGQQLTRGVSATTDWNGFVWREADASVRRCYVLEWYAYDTYFSKMTENNSRTGKIDLKPGVQFIVDYNNSINMYEVQGTLPVFEECRDNLAKMQTIDDAGTKDKAHLKSGFVVPWPGVTPQYSPMG